MTDAEKELRRRAQDAVSGRRSGWTTGPAEAADILALLDRIEALEKQAAEAERKGAEEMRKAVVIRLRQTSIGLDYVGRVAKDYDIKHELYDRSTGYSEAADDTEALPLPLPGDAP